MRPSQANLPPQNREAKAPATPGREKLQRLRQQRDQLYEEARDNPDSDAGEMVRELLLSGIMSTQSESEEDELVRRSLVDERRQQRLGGRQAAEETGLETLSSGARAERAERRVRETEAALEEVARLAAEAASRPTMDASAVYRRIAEIIGLQSPAEQARERQSGAESEGESR